jgi:hypothetical protein
MVMKKFENDAKFFRKNFEWVYSNGKKAVTNANFIRDGMFRAII